MLSVDSAKPLYEEEAGSEISWGPDDSQPLTMQHKANCNQWPPYQHSIMADGSKGEEPDKEPQPLTKAIKGGALESSSLERSSSLEASLVALRPPPSPFRVRTDALITPLCNQNYVSANLRSRSESLS